VIPPTKSAAFVWRMEEVLDLYEEPYDPETPMICFDEQPYQMLSDVRDPLPMKPGRPEHVDFKYQREGNAYCVHMTFEPLRGFREVEITERRRKERGVRSSDGACCRRSLPGGREDKGGLGQSLHPHRGGLLLLLRGLPRTAGTRSLATKIEFIYTPVHGSWLNMAEIELSVLGRQCLKRRIPDTKALRREAKAWQKERNQLGRSVD
jgi:hypothetical protein